MSDVLRVALVIVVVVLLIARRMYGEPLQPMRVFLLPPVFLVIGGYDFAKSAHGAIHPVDVAFLALGAVIALAFGVGRGLSVGLFERDGHLWMRYRVRTLLLWLLLIGIRVLLNLAGQAAGAHAATANTALMLMFGLTLAAESAVLALRATASGIPYAPTQVGRGRGLLDGFGGGPRDGGGQGGGGPRGGGGRGGGRIGGSRLGGGPLGRGGRRRF